MLIYKISCYTNAKICQKNGLNDFFPIILATNAI